MKSLTVKELYNESQVFTNLWEFIKSHAIPENDSDWEKVVEDIKDFVKKSHNQAFATDMALCVIKEIERREKARQSAA